MNHIDLKNKTIFVTGSAGFIGSNLVLELLKTQSPINIIGLDNMNDYYDVNIKEWRLQEIEKCVSEHSDSTYVFYKDDLANFLIYIQSYGNSHYQFLSTVKLITSVFHIFLFHM